MAKRFKCVWHGKGICIHQTVKSKRSANECAYIYVHKCAFHTALASQPKINSWDLNLKSFFFFSFKNCVFAARSALAYSWNFIFNEKFLSFFLTNRFFLVFSKIKLFFFTHLITAILWWWWLFFLSSAAVFLFNFFFCAADSITFYVYIYCKYECDTRWVTSFSFVFFLKCHTQILSLHESFSTLTPNYLLRMKNLFACSNDFFTSFM